MKEPLRVSIEVPVKKWKTGRVKEIETWLRRQGIFPPYHAHENWIENKVTVCGDENPCFDLRELE